MSTLSGSRVLLVVLLAPALFAQKPAVSSEATATAARARCTDLSGKIPKPCPTEGESPVRGAGSTSTGPNRCTNLAGKEVPCPASVETNSAAVVAGEPARLPMHCTNLAGKEVPCPSDAGTIVPAAVQTNPGAESTGCADLAGRELACPSSVTSGPVATTRHAPTGPSLERSLPVNLVQDQRFFWTSPARLREKDLHWLLPFSVVTAGLIGNDRGIESHLPTNPDTIRRSKDFSNYGAAGLVAGAGAFYLWGRATDNAHMRETGWLSGEALLNSFAVSYAMKGITQRERPLDGNGRGNFWTGSNPFNSSFPSQHAVAAWSVASVIAHEYPSPLTQFLAYGAAAAVSATRVTGRQHWTSDAFIGSALGWYMGRQVYRAHAGGEDRGQWGTFEPGPRETARDPADMGSPYVPLDSWVYPAIERLAALGYVQTAFLGLRPWTRMECSRLVREAQDQTMRDEPTGNQSGRLVDQLAREFRDELGLLEGVRNRQLMLESFYSRVTGISGPPLRDGYHFGQTIINDYGRPYAEGTNLVAGLSARAAGGPLAFYVRAEYQHAPSLPGYSQGVQDAIQQADSKPPVAAQPLAGADQLRLLEAYVALNLGNNQLSFGKQSLWWGPTTSPFLFSDNAEPIYMLRLNRVSPFRLPGPFGILGPVRTDFFIGRLAGQHFVNTQLGSISEQLGRPLQNQPFINGQKISFKPTPNLEFGFSKTGVFGGPDFPVTMASFLRSVASRGNAFGHTDPGDRRGGFDFSYKLPGLRRWVVLYNDAFTEDEINPIGYPRRSAMNPGIYFPQIPKLNKLDFRAEGGYTDLPGLFQPPHGGFIYWNTRYLDGYTNEGNIMGNWIGRQGRGLLFASTYWISPRDRVQVLYRKAMVNPKFLEGGYLQDVAVRSDFMLRPDLSFSGSIQYEHWKFPLLSTERQSNFLASFQITFWPAWRIK